MALSLPCDRGIPDKLLPHDHPENKKGRPASGKLKKTKAPKGDNLPDLGDKGQGESQ